ncbi:hypothetical protein diail_501 [Diaporthe ilicicola]|nr:hypothetical protein diail_501 [Diaporthe ilicicola]
MASDSFGSLILDLEAEPSKMDSIDNALRLDGLDFPKGIYVIGRKNADLLIALGAVNLSRNTAGNKKVVTQRLCVLYDAAIYTSKNNPSMDITSGAFYEAAIYKISKDHPNMSKFLTTWNVQHVIAHYFKEFHRSGMKLIKPAYLTAAAMQDCHPDHRDTAQHNDGGVEESTGEKPSTMVLKTPTDCLPGSRDHLEELQTIKDVSAKSEQDQKEISQLKKDKNKMRRQHDELEEDLGCVPAAYAQSRDKIDGLNDKVDGLECKLKEQHENHLAHTARLEAQSERMQAFIDT